MNSVLKLRYNSITKAFKLIIKFELVQSFEYLSIIIVWWSGKVNYILLKKDYLWIFKAGLIKQLREKRRTSILNIQTLQTRSPQNILMD